MELFEASSVADFLGFLLKTADSSRRFMLLCRLVKIINKKITKAKRPLNWQKLSFCYLHTGF